MINGRIDLQKRILARNLNQEKDLTQNELISFEKEKFLMIRVSLRLQ